MILNKYTCKNSQQCHLSLSMEPHGYGPHLAPPITNLNTQAYVHTKVGYGETFQTLPSRDCHAFKWALHTRTSMLRGKEVESELRLQN